MVSHVVSIALATMATSAWVILLVAAYKRISPDATEKNGTVWVTYNPLFKVLGAYSFLLFACLIVLLLWTAVAQAQFIPPRDLKIALLVTFIPAFRSTRYLLFRVGYNAEHLIYRSRWGEKNVIPWGEIQSIRFSYPRKGWLVSTWQHGTLHIPTTLSGIPSFFAAIEAHGIPLQPDA